MNLYLSGVICSGKTTIGFELSKRLSLPFLDLDQEMDRRLGYSFHRLVKENGWLAFRELEYSICRYFADQSNSVVCLGGGTVRYEWNRDVLRGSGVVVHLEADEETLIERISRADRPRVNPGTDLTEDVRRICREHSDTYRSAADFICRSDEKSLNEEIEDLLDLINTNPAFSSLKHGPA